jgi:hypothetical protein
MTAKEIGAPHASLRLLLLATTALIAASALTVSVPAYADDQGNGRGGDNGGFDSDHFQFEPGTLVISSTTYDRTQGAVRLLNVGTALPNTATATTTAVASNNYVTVWNNETVDASFGVTSAIELHDVDPFSGRVIHRGLVPTNQVVTSFSSKSELGLHISQAWPRARLTFMGYASAGVGALDVSNSDAVPGQDPTNPVTHAFGNNYAFARTVVSIDAEGKIAYTPTIDYGGNNGRSALLGSNGLYYTVGNANNGNAATFGASNGTNPDVTETTGLDAVNPIDAMFLPTTIPPNNSAEVDPLLQMTFNGKQDKAGKDDNFRGVTEYGGALYFTKGSGSNGVQTVYTITSTPALPTVAQASAATIGILPGFPTDSAKVKLADGTSGGNYTPFAVFFANPTTMYVTDEGTGNSTDVSTHAGLEKWSLVSGTWQLDYVLTKGLIGVVDSNLNGPDGAYPAVTTIGLRNLTGTVGRDGKVTLWAATSTSSASGDNGADPNRVVRITDDINATSLSSDVANETFATIEAPVYGSVYRGVAFVDMPGSSNGGQGQNH